MYVFFFEKVCFSSLARAIHTAFGVRALTPTMPQSKLGCDGGNACYGIFVCGGELVRLGRHCTGTDAIKIE